MRKTFKCLGCNVRVDIKYIGWKVKLVQNFFSPCKNWWLPYSSKKTSYFLTPCWYISSLQLKFRQSLKSCKNGKHSLDIQAYDKSPAGGIYSQSRSSTSVYQLMYNFYTVQTSRISLLTFRHIPNDPRKFRYCLSPIMPNLPICIG